MKKHKPTLVHPVHGPEPTGTDERRRWRRAWTLRELRGLLAAHQKHRLRAPTWVLTRISVEHSKAIKVMTGQRGPTVNGMTADQLALEQAGGSREVEFPFHGEEVSDVA